MANKRATDKRKRTGSKQPRPSAPPSPAHKKETGERDRAVPASRPARSRKGNAAGAAVPIPTANRIEQRRLEDLQPYEGNAKEHPPDQIRRLAETIKATGFCAPLLVHGASIVAGHGRYLAARLLGLDTVPVVPLDHLDDEMARVLRIADNRIGELGGWNLAALEAEVRAIADADVEAVAAAGFTGGELAAAGIALDGMLRELSSDHAGGPGGRGASRDKVLDVPKPGDVRTKPGDVWELGRHRIACGSCTETKTVARATGGKDFELLVTDPPYCSGGFQEAAQAAGTWGKIAGDNLSTRGWRALLGGMLKAANPQACYLFTDWRQLCNLSDLSEAHGFAARAMIVWDKGCPSLGSFWRTQHEFVLYVARHPMRRKKGGASAGNVLTAKRSGNRYHYTEKPVDLLTQILRADAGSGRAGAVLDPFLGSGPTLLACELLNRTCYGIEIEPLFCDVAVLRWEHATGGTAKRKRAKK